MCWHFWPTSMVPLRFPRPRREMNGWECKNLNFDILRSEGAPSAKREVWRGGSVEDDAAASPAQRQLREFLHRYCGQTFANCHPAIVIADEDGCLIFRILWLQRCLLPWWSQCWAPAQREADAGSYSFLLNLLPYFVHHVHVHDADDVYYM